MQQLTRLQKSICIVYLLTAAGLRLSINTGVLHTMEAKLPNVDARMLEGAVQQLRKCHLPPRLQLAPEKFQKCRSSLLLLRRTQPATPEINPFCL